MLGALLPAEPLGLPRVGSLGTGFLLLLDQVQPQRRCRGGMGLCSFLQMVGVSPGDRWIGTHLAASVARWQHLWVASVKGARILLWFLRAGIFFFHNSCEYSQNKGRGMKQPSALPGSVVLFHMLSWWVGERISCFRDFSPTPPMPLFPWQGALQRLLVGGLAGV